MINLTFLLRSLKRRCYGNQLSFWHIAKADMLPALFFALAFHNELEYCNVNMHIKSSDDTSTSFTNLGRPVNPKITRLKCEIFDKDDTDYYTI